MLKEKMKKNKKKIKRKNRNTVYPAHEPPRINRTNCFVL